MFRSKFYRIYMGHAIFQDLINRFPYLEIVFKLFGLFDFYHNERHIFVLAGEGLILIDEWICHIGVIVLPLMGFIAASVLGRFMGKKITCDILVSFIVIGLVGSFKLFISQSINKDLCSIFIYSKWVSTPTVSINWEALFDNVTIIMLIVIYLVSYVVHVYSVDYMGDDLSLIRFMSYLSLFTFFMITLVTSNNYLQLFFGWEGVGICSYLLISFWYSRLEAVKSGLKAIMVNKVGDFFLFGGILSCYYIFNSVDYGVIFNLVDLVLYYNLKFWFFDINGLIFIGIFFLIGAIGKSAQLGLHTWLPDAMEGPTPVSALIHAATMVTAGIFLVIRSSFIFEQIPDLLAAFILIGSLTSFFGASIAVVQVDLKKIIAYSTCSQLGYMLFVCGLSGYNVALYHLLNHAFFKALLFLSAGLVIHNVFDEQDLRKISKFEGRVLQKIILWFFVIGSLAISGCPGFSGFYSKDKIIESAFVNYSFLGLFSFSLGVLTALLTSYYSFRLLYLTFWCRKKTTINKSVEFRPNKKISLHQHKNLIRPLSFLVLGSIFSGYLLENFFIGVGTDFFNRSLPVFRAIKTLLLIEFIPIYIKIIPTFFSFLGFILAYIFLDGTAKNITYFIYNISFIYNSFFFFFKKWNFDKIYNCIFANFFVKTFAYDMIILKLEKGLLEYIVFNSLPKSIYMIGGFVSKKFHTGSIYKSIQLVILIISCFYFLLSDLSHSVFFFISFFIEGSNIISDFKL